MGRIRGRLSFANVMSVAALFAALGGSAYAVEQIGSRDIAKDAVKSRHIADQKIRNRHIRDGNVNFKSIAEGTILGMNVAADTLTGDNIDESTLNLPPGNQGPQGPQGPGASRIAYDRPASGSPQLTNVLNVNGFKLAASCEQNGADTIMNLVATADEDAVMDVNFVSDQGTDLHVPGPGFTGNVRIDIPAGVATSVGGPSATDPDYGRATTTAVVTMASGTISLDLVTIADADADRCIFNGTAVPA